MASSPRDALVEIALLLLNESHPEDLSVREVARQAGLSSGAPYHHFGDKVGLLAACAEVAWKDLCERLERTPEGATLEKSLHHYARAYVEYALDHPGPYRLMGWRQLDDDERFERVAMWRRRAMQGLVELVAQALGPGPGGAQPKLPWRRAMAVWALLHGHVTLVLDGSIPRAMAAGVTTEVCQMAVRMALVPRDAEVAT
ncbi:MAG: TetR/AcrR family transcriptional regulator [Myxococcota bacterium]